MCSLQTIVIFTFTPIVLFLHSARRPGTITFFMGIVSWIDSMHFTLAFF